MKHFIIFIVAAFTFNIRGLIYAVNGEMDNVAYCFFLSILSVMGITIWKIINDDKNEEVTDNDNIQIDQYTAFNIMKKALINIGCQPTVNEDNTIYAAYQGENFYISCIGLYATIWDSSWSYIEANDSDLPKIREAVNTANINFGHTIVLGEPDDKGNIDFHTKRSIMLHPSFPDATEYIQAELNEFFPVKGRVKEIYQQIDLKQKEAHKERRPIGFTAQE